MRAVLAAVALLTLTSAASAHEWYSEKRDPVYKWRCCGGNDCAVLKITRRNLVPEAGGLRVILSLVESREINPTAMEPINALVPWNRIQASETNDWGLCISAAARVQPTYGVYCLFEPPSM